MGADSLSFQLTIYQLITLMGAEVQPMIELILSYIAILLLGAVLGAGIMAAHALASESDDHQQLTEESPCSDESSEK